MKKLPILILLAIVGASAACDSDNENTWDKYKDWRETNDNWILEMQNRTDQQGNPYYKVIVPDWDPSAFVLVHYFNDRDLTADNLSPLYTSTCDVIYIGHLCNDEPFDSSYLNTSYGPAIYRTRPDQVINGWATALSDMHVGDTAEVIIPYSQAYGSSTVGSILPYSHLRFNLRLVDIPYYEISPK